MVVPVIVSTNHKGGVGKTTTSRALTQTLADMKDFTNGKPILVIDLDPQGNTSSRWKAITVGADGTNIPVQHPALVGQDPDYSSICDLWLDMIIPGAEGLEPEPYPTYNPMVHVVPVHETQMLEIEAIPRGDRERMAGVMINWLRSDHIAEKYSCVIIDTQPSKNTPLNEVAILSATHVYIPFVPEPQSIQGVFSIISKLNSLQRHPIDNVQLEILGFLPNQVQRTTLHRQHMKVLTSSPVFEEYLMPVQLRRRIGYSETDDWRNLPDKVTDLKGSDIEVEVFKFASYVAKRIKASQTSGTLAAVGGAS